MRVEFTALDPASRVEYAKSDKVDIVLANFTVTKERAQQVDFALPYMKVALGVVSPQNAVIKSLDELKGKTLIITKGTTAETFFSKHKQIKLLKFDQYAQAYNALLDGRGDAFSTDNTEVLAWSKANKGFEVGIASLGEIDTIAPAVKKGNKSLLEWLNNEIIELGKEQFFHKNYDETLRSIYGQSSNADKVLLQVADFLLYQFHFLWRFYGFEVLKNPRLLLALLAHLLFLYHSARLRRNGLG